MLILFLLMLSQDPLPPGTKKIDKIDKIVKKDTDILPLKERPWPKEVQKPLGMVRYTPTLYTQRIYNLRERTDKVSRYDTATKWHQSGGMEGVKGWKSDLYKFIPKGHQEWMGDIAVINNLPPKGWQWERGYLRSYPDGTIFMDVLSKDGIVFEHRERRKLNGKWQSRVLYKNEDARPFGYKGLTQSCASCHDEAGSGNYGVALVPGGDTVLSDPFVGLEKR